MSLNHFLTDLEFTDPKSKPSPRSRRPITIQVSQEVHARWERLQASTGKKFGKKARELLMALMDAAESRV